MKTIYFDSTSSEWRKNWESNRLFLWAAMHYFKDMVKYRGYLYLNQIYEYIGMTWNPNDENVCYRNPNTFSIDWRTDGDGKTVITVS